MLISVIINLINVRAIHFSLGDQSPKIHREIPANLNPQSWFLSANDQDTALDLIFLRN